MSPKNLLGTIDFAGDGDQRHVARALHERAAAEAVGEARVVDRGDVPSDDVQVAAMARGHDPEVGCRAVDADAPHAGGGDRAAEGAGAAIVRQADRRLAEIAAIEAEECGRRASPGDG